MRFLVVFVSTLIFACMPVEAQQQLDDMSFAIVLSPNENIDADMSSGPYPAPYVPVPGGFSGFSTAPGFIDSTYVNRTPKNDSKPTQSVDNQKKENANDLHKITVEYLRDELKRQFEESSRAIKSQGDTANRAIDAMKSGNDLIKSVLTMVLAVATALMGVFGWWIRKRVVEVETSLTDITSKIKFHNQTIQSVNEQCKSMQESFSEIEQRLEKARVLMDSFEELNVEAVRKHLKDTMHILNYARQQVVATTAREPVSRLLAVEKLAACNDISLTPTLFDVIEQELANEKSPDIISTAINGIIRYGRDVYAGKEISAERITRLFTECLQRDVMKNVRMTAIRFVSRIGSSDKPIQGNYFDDSYAKLKKLVEEIAGDESDNKEVRHEAKNALADIEFSKGNH